jgi:hypothetical protein
MFGQMDESTKVIGLITTCTDKEHILGKMEENMTEIT